MSQILPQKCPQCGAPVAAGQRFCPNCGSAVSQPTNPTVASSGVANTLYSGAPSHPGYNAYAPSPSTPSYPDYSPLQANASNPSYPGVTPSIPPPPQAQPGSAGPYAQYNSGLVPPPAPTDPYSNPKPFYPKPAADTKRLSLVPILIVLVILILLGGTGIIFLARNGSTGKGGANTGNGSNTADTYSTTQSIDLTIVYSSDQITFNKIEQATKFADDSDTSYGSLDNIKDYVRVDFNEKQTASTDSYFSYYDSFRLKLPDGTIVQAQKSEEFSGPEQGVQRPNWVDFPSTQGEVDLSNLTIILGTTDEAQMTFPLKTNADVSKYQPKTFTLNSTFKYAGMDMTIKSAAQSYYYDGQQAKAGKVFLTIALNADNNQDSSIYLTPSDFLRLKTSDATVSPDYSSDLDNFDIIDPQTTGIMGTAIFDVTPSPDGKYTLIFEKGDNFDEVDKPIQLS